MTPDDGPPPLSAEELSFRTRMATAGANGTVRDLIDAFLASYEEGESALFAIAEWVRRPVEIPDDPELDPHLSWTDELTFRLVEVVIQLGISAQTTAKMIKAARERGVEFQLDGFLSRGAHPEC